MGRPPRRQRLERAAAVALFAALAAVAAAQPARAGSWGKAFRLAGPESLDALAPQIAFSPSGAAAVAFAVQDIDDPRHSSAYLVIRTAAGRLTSARRVPGAQQVLDLAYDGSALELLAGTSPQKYPCCSSVDATRFSNGAFGAAGQLVRGLAGPTLGRLLVISGRTLAAVATERGVWEAESLLGGRFGTARRVDRRGELPESLGTSTGSGRQTVLVWTARSSQYAPGPRSIFAAKGSGASAPHGATVAISVPTGHRIDELTVAHGSSGATVAWTESWFDTLGAYHAQTMVADVSHHASPRLMSSAGALASGVAFAANRRGAQVLGWRECDPTGACTVRAALRPRRGRFRPAQLLGSIDAAQNPAVAVSDRGNALLGWVDGGEVRAAAARTAGGGFGPPQPVSSTPLSGNLALAFGPAGTALAAWTTTAQIVFGAVYR